MRALTALTLLLAFASPCHAQSGPPLEIPAPAVPVAATPGAPGDPAGLQQALRNFPPLIIVNNVHAVTTPGTPLPPSCPKTGSRVEQKGGPTLEFLGAVEGKPDLCHMRVEGTEFDAWYGIWATTWPVPTSPTAPSSVSCTARPATSSASTPSPKQASPNGMTSSATTASRRSDCSTRPTPPSSCRTTARASGAIPTAPTVLFGSTSPLAFPSTAPTSTSPASLNSTAVSVPTAIVPAP